MLKRIAFSTGLLVVMVAVCGRPLFAQATAAINGRVVDQGGAVLPGATVTVTETSTGVAREVVSNADGLYSVPALNPGTYSVKADLAGFAAQVRNNVSLLIGATLTVDLQMGLAGIQESVTVTGQSALIET